MRLILMRHGESTSDLEPRRIEGMADFPLTDTGLAQAAALGRRIAADYQLDELICSPLQRARQTAAAITASAGIVPQVDDRIREKSWGLLGGLTFQEASEQFPEVNFRNHAVDAVAPEGDSFLQHFARVSEFWFWLCRGKQGRTIGIVTHGGTIQCLYRLALGLPVNTLHSFWNGDTSVHEWLVDPSGAVTIVTANCTRHLSV